MKRFLVFGTNLYEGNGGWGDFKVAADTLEEARFLGDAGEFDFCEVVDLEKMAVVVKFSTKRLLARMTRERELKDLLDRQQQELREFDDIRSFANPGRK